MLKKRKEELFIVHRAEQPSPSYDLDHVIEQALSQVKFSRTYNSLKLQNTPSCKLTIVQCH